MCVGSPTAGTWSSSRWRPDNEFETHRMDVWVLHAFQKKAKTGIKTPKTELELVRDRLRRLKKELRQ